MSVIRTDKWQLDPSPQQRLWMERTIVEYRAFVRALVGVIYARWPRISTADAPLQEVERLVHRTQKNPYPRYEYFGQRFHKFPSYYRRAAINNAIGQVSSFVTRYRDWQAGIRSRKTAKPPRLTADTGVYPSLYKGQCVKFHDNWKTAEIKVFNGCDWVWTCLRVRGHRKRHLVATNQQKSPALIVNSRHCHLSVPFAVKPKPRQASEAILAVDLGINTTATVAVIASDGTVKHRKFIHPSRDIDRRDNRLQQIRRKAKLTGKLHKGFCRGRYRKARHINQNIAQQVSRQIVEIARQFGVKTIVLEHLKGWRPKGGRKRSNLKQRFHGWLHRRLAELIEMKWTELGGNVAYVNPAYTSKMAFDGSGRVRRDSNNYALARFASGKRYNADLNGCYNIGARYWCECLKLGSRNGSEVREDKRSARTPRIPVTLSTLWDFSSQYRGVDTSLTPTG